MNTTPAVLPIQSDGDVLVPTQRFPVARAILLKMEKRALTWLDAPVWTRRRGRKQSEAWLARSGERNIRLRDFLRSRKGMIAQVIPLSALFMIATLLSSYALAELDTTSLFRMGINVLLVGSTFMFIRWTATIAKGPIRTDMPLPGVERLRDAANAKGDVHRLADLEVILLALDIQTTYGKPEIFMERVKSELGMDDACGLMLMLALPDEVDAPRGGEAEELLARVAELART